jgi:hypothetical protein
MSNERGTVVWHGTVLLVTKPTQITPKLEIESLGAYDPNSSSTSRSHRTTVDGLRLYEDPDKTFWRFALDITLSNDQTKWQYTIPNAYFKSSASKEKSRQFVVPSANESMRIMFHSCNGFSVGTDEDFWSGMKSITTIRDGY